MPLKEFFGEFGIYNLRNLMKKIINVSRKISEETPGYFLVQDAYICRLNLKI